MKRIGDRSWRNRTSRFLSTGYLESDGRCGGGLCHYFVFLCHAYVSWVAQFTQSSSTLLSDKKVLVSTGSKALQEQLFHRDLPTLKKILGKGKKISKYTAPHPLFSKA